MSLDFYQTAAGPPASKPRKKPALFTVSFSDPDSHRAPSRLRVPNTADKVHCDETRGETFDKVPATMELLQKISTVSLNVSPLRNILVCIPTLSKRDVKGQRISNSVLAPPHERGGTVRNSEKRWRLPYAGMSADQVQTV